MVMRIFRWLLLVPAGIFESFLLVLAFFCAAIGRYHAPAKILAMDIVKYAMKMPDINWYCGKEA